MVTGGTGFVGRAVVAELRSGGHHVVLLVRNPAQRRAGSLEDSAVTVKPGDILDPASVESAAQGVDAVVHLVGIISEAGRSTFSSIHVDGTKHVLRATRQAGVRRYVHMSALGTRPNAASRYHQTKWEAETAVRQSDLDWTIFRPSLIYGAEDHFVNLFRRISRWSPVLPMLGSAGGRLQPVSVQEVAVCFARALEIPAAVGQTYELCGADVVGMAELLDLILEAEDRRRWKVRLPRSLAWGQAAVLERVFPFLLGRPSPLTRDQLRMLDEENVGNRAPAEATFGLKFRHLREGIRQIVQAGMRGASR